MWRYKTKAGTFYIKKMGNLFHVMFEEQDIGGYGEPEHAAEDLSCGRTFSLSSGIDPEKLMIPEDLSAWDFIPEDR